MTSHKANTEAKTPNSQPLELIPKSTAEKLDGHIKKIRTYIAGQRKGAAEQFGYAFLAGRVLLQAKNDIPNGNSGQPGTGFQKWVETNFPDITHRTATRWMVFAEAITAVISVDAPKSPLLLGVGKLNVQARNSILNLVPKVMDGKGMMEFMRSSRLLLDPEKPEHTPQKPVTKQEANKFKAERARRVSKSIRGDLDTGKKILKWLGVEDLKQQIDAAVDYANACREQLKKLKVEPENETP